MLLAATAFAIAWMTTTALAQEGDDGETIVLRNGDGEPGFAVNAYLPAELTVRTGTTVSWEFPWIEPHSVTFGDAGEDVQTPSGTDFDGSEAVSSGVIFGGDGATWDLNFTAAGEYQFHCLIHPFQTMTVTVVDDGEVDSQADVDARGEAYYQDALGRAKDVAAELRGAPVQSEELGDGATKWTVINGGATEDGHDAFLYAPSPITITEGDTIKWVNQVPVPHTVTFGQPPQPGDPFGIPASTPEDSYEGEGFWNSGIMFGIPGAMPGAVQTFEMTFSEAGTYDYYCMLHVDMGHQGQVIVEAAAVDDDDDDNGDDDDDDETPVATATPGAPSTGTAAADGNNGMQSLAILGAIVVLTGLSAAAFRATRARNSHEA